MNSSRSAILRRGTAASAVLFVFFLAAWEWGPGLLGIPAFVVPPASAV
jgi:NitT/TauT family transport system permease protein